MWHLFNDNSKILSALVDILIWGPYFIYMSFLQWVLIRSMLTSKQLPHKRQTRQNNQTTRPRKSSKRGDRTMKNNYTKIAPKG